MLNAIWLAMIFLSVVVGIFMGRVDQVVAAVTNSAKLGFEFALSLTGVMALWLGMMRIAADSGLVDKLARGLKPILRPLFPEVPIDDPAMGAILMNIAANMFGLGNAATPFGLQAMKELQRLNARAEEASDAMCTLLALNTSSLQLIPATAIAFLAANGGTHPNSIIVSSLLATLCSTLVAIIAVKKLAKLSFFRLKPVVLDRIDEREGTL